MMTNLFSSFDPSSSLMYHTLWFNLNWSSMFIVFLLSPVYFLSKSLMANLLLKLSLFNKNETKLALPYSLVLQTFLYSLFLFFILNNTMGLFPYLFTATSHVHLTLTFSVTLWLSSQLVGWVKNWNTMTAHFVPVGTPTVLLPFMVLIETISNLIRPLTLAVRLTANMIAGHLLMSLLGSQFTSNGKFIMMLLMVQFLLILLESAVSVIQAYVFSTLLTLYLSDVSN